MNEIRENAGGGIVQATPAPEETTGGTAAKLMASVGGGGTGRRSESLADKGEPGRVTVYSLAKDIHEHLSSTLTFADQKAAFLFSAVAAVLAYLHTHGVTKRWLMNPLNWRIGDGVACVTIIALVAAATFALLVIAPRSGPSICGLIYWKAIADFESPEDFADRVFSVDSVGLAREQLQDCYHLAQICRRKYSAVNRAIWCGCIGLAGAVLYVAFVN